VGDLLAEDPADLLVERSQVAFLVQDGNHELDRPDWAR
jgi:hypothetical protein